MEASHAGVQKEVNCLGTLRLIWRCCLGCWLERMYTRRTHRLDHKAVTFSVMTCTPKQSLIRMKAVVYTIESLIIDVEKEA